MVWDLIVDFLMRRLVNNLATDLTIRTDLYGGNIGESECRSSEKSYDMSMMRHRNPRDREADFCFFWGGGRGEQDSYFCELQRVFKDLKPIADS